jgi:TorA maturation chaperone TorD
VTRRHGEASSTPQLSRSQIALARGRDYRLFGRLYLMGLDEDTLSIAQAIPELAPALSQPFDSDEAAADHYHLFGFNVFPYQSIFLGVDGSLGGDSTEAVARCYQEAGFVGVVAGALESESADHIGHELGLLAFLSAAEADAWAAENPAVAEQMASRQCTFLYQHLLRWLPSLVLAVRQQAHPFYAALADLTVDLVHSHCSDYKATHHAGSRDEGAGQVLAPPDLLGDENSSLQDIAQYLLTPPYSGIYLSRDDIGRLARRQDLPRGFGSRKQMLVNTLRSAATYDGLGLLLGTLHELAEGWGRSYDEMAIGPQSNPFADAWRARAGRTAMILAEMAAQAEDFRNHK